MFDVYMMNDFASLVGLISRDPYYQGSNSIGVEQFCVCIMFN